MNKVPIKDLPMSDNGEYEIVILDNIKTRLLIKLESCEYLISKPKNSSWNNVELVKGMVLIIKKAKYGRDNEYDKLNLVKIVRYKHTTKRKFNLPGVDELNKGQDKVLRLPQNGQFLIVGGPGTGKSVVALLRTLRYYKNNDYTFLVFNKVLSLATSQLIDINLNNFTLDSFFYKKYYEIFQENIPTIEPMKPDYGKIIEKLKTKNMPEASHHLIIDEGQDKPPIFYDSLMHFGYDNFFIVADQNQQITEDNSSRQELADKLGLEINDVIELTENYRNSHQIALFSQFFFTDPSSPLPKLPTKSRLSLDVPTLYEYTNLNDCVKFILREADKDSRNLIGVIVPNNSVRNEYVETLETEDIQLDNPKPTISTYSSTDNQNVNIDFSNGGIIVLNDKSIKGLEFDIVFIIIDEFKVYNDTNNIKKRFYVMSSRAIKKLVLFKYENYSGNIESILPKDNNILKRERLNSDQKA